MLSHTLCRRYLTGPNRFCYKTVCIGKTYRPEDAAAKRKDNKGKRELVWWFDHHEPIISQEIFAQVIAEKERRSNIKYDEEGVRKQKSTRYVSNTIHANC